MTTLFSKEPFRLTLPGCFFAMTFSNFLVEMVLFFGRDFSSGIFFVEMFCHILFGRQMSLKRLFGRDIFSRFAMCLFGASLVLCFERHSGRESV